MSTAHKSYWVHIITNRPHGTLYIGVTNSLYRRMWQHKTGTNEGFSKRYGLKMLVWFEEFKDVNNAIDRETELKGWLRKRKVALIESGNQLWRDLSAEWFATTVLDSSLRSE